MMADLTKRDRVEALIQGLSPYIEVSHSPVAVPRRLIRDAVNMLKEDYGIQEVLDLDGTNTD